MEMPDIPDDRPHKPASLLTSPTILLDDCDPEYPESQYNDKPSESDKLLSEHTPEQWWEMTLHSNIEIMNSIKADDPHY